MKHTITLIPGDGIGPEIVAATVRVIEATGVEIDWETHILGAQAQEKFGTTLPDETIESIKRNKVALKGPQMTPIGKGFTSVNVGLRKALDLYANLRPVRALPNIESRNPQLDLVIVRENTEDLYAGLEHVVVPGVVESLKIITEKASRICTAISSRTCARGSSADSGSRPERISASRERYSRRCTARLRILQDKGSRIRRR
jgi:isocitrate dehydrogenase (NAD+)